MAKVLKIIYDEITLYEGEVGKFNWAESGSGGISVNAEPPRAPGPNPALQVLSETLKSASKAGIASARESAAAKAAAE